MTVDAGDVVLVDFPGVQGSKRRPAVVLSSAIYHAARPDVILGLITTQTAKATAVSNHALADWAAAGLRQPSAFRAFVATHPRHQVRRILGKLSATDWHAVRGRVRLSLDV